MRDLNFFEPYLEKKSLKFGKIMILYVLSILVALSIIAYTIFNQLQINTLKADVRDRKVVAEDAKTVEKVNEIKTLEEEVSIFREEVIKIKDLDETIDANDVIGEELIKSVKSKMSDDMFLTSFSAYSREIQLSGIAKDRYTVAEFAKGLEQIKDADEVFVSNIIQEDENSKFEINITLKEVMINGEEETVSQ